MEPRRPAAEGHRGCTMSLTSFLDMPDVTAKVKLLRPKLPRKLSAPLKIKPRSNRYMLVGTAFDYLLRFELQRRAPHAISKRWVAEYAPDICQPTQRRTEPFGGRNKRLP